MSVAPVTGSTLQNPHLHWHDERKKLQKSVSVVTDASNEDEPVDSLPSKLRLALLIAVFIYVMLSVVLGAMVVKQERFSVCLIAAAMLTVYFLVALLLLELIIRRFHGTEVPEPEVV